MPLTLKGATLHHREGLLVELRREDGATGWGEASPLPGFSRESLDDAARRLHGLAAAAVGRETLEIPPGVELTRGASAPSADFGFELATRNLYAKVQGKSLSEVLSPRLRDRVPVNGLLSGPAERVLEDAARMRRAGYEAVKLKVGGRGVGEDAELVRAVKRELGAVRLRLDANRAWGFEEAKEFARLVGGVGYEYVEEPLSDPAGLARLAREHGVPVALDESLVGMEVVELERYRYARAVVIKPTLLGGISHALRLAGRATELGITSVVSATYETGVGMLALVALAASVGGSEVPAGLDTYRRLAADVLRPPLDLSTPVLDVRRLTDVWREVVRDYLSPYRIT